MPTTCPSDHQLRALLRGDGPEVQLAHWTDHLEHCPACQMRLEAFAGGSDSLVLPARAEGGAPETPRLREVMKQLKAGTSEATGESSVITSDRDQSPGSRQRGAINPNGRRSL